MMRRRTRTRIVGPAVALMLLPAVSAMAQDQEYAGLEGVTSTETVFDFRIGDPENALTHLNLIHQMLENRALQPGNEQPEFVIVFSGPSVKLLAGDQPMPEDNGNGNPAGSGADTTIAEKISAMTSDGVRFEACMATAHALDIPVAAIPPDVVQVGNGWISVIGYQHRGYALVPAF